MNQNINEITDTIIGAAFRVSNVLGSGFLEKVYEKALLIELRKDGIEVEAQYPLKLTYDDIVGSSGMIRKFFN